MDEQTPDPHPTGGTHGSARTGNHTVDAVLASMDELDGRPVAEHVAVFEAAHEKLRQALSDAGDPDAQGPRGPGVAGSGG